MECQQGFQRCLEVDLENLETNSKLTPETLSPPQLNRVYFFTKKGPLRGPENIENRLLLISMDNTYVPGSKLPLFPYNRG